MALATAAPIIPSTIFIRSPISLFMNCSASQPATPPMMIAAIQPICGSFMACLLKKRVRAGFDCLTCRVQQQVERVYLQCTQLLRRIREARQFAGCAVGGLKKLAKVRYRTDEISPEERYSIQWAVRTPFIPHCPQFRDR